MTSKNFNSKATTPVLISSHEKTLIEALKTAGIESPQRELQLLSRKAAGDEGLLRQLIQRRLNHEPMSQILERKGFWQDEFIVSRHVLTPRPDSEVLIEEALKALPDTARPYRFLDLGTGSGCLLLSLLREYPKAFGRGIDISSEALTVAQSNAEALNLAERCCFQHGNWAKGLTEGFDLVISNPPYIPDGDIATLMPEVTHYEPHLALKGGNDGLLFYHEIADELSLLLDEGSTLIFEVGQGQAEEVAAIAQQRGFTRVNIRKDYGGVERAVVLRKD